MLRYTNIIGLVLLSIGLAILIIFWIPHSKNSFVLQTTPVQRVVEKSEFEVTAGPFPIADTAYSAYWVKRVSDGSLFSVNLNSEQLLVGQRLTLAVVQYLHNPIAPATVLLPIK